MSDSLIINTATNLEKTMSKINNTFWIPDLNEFTIFILFICVMFFTLVLFHYGEIQRHVANSRCALQSTNKASGIFSVYALNASNDKLYHIDYNFDAKAFDIECDCQQGDYINTFSNISTYDMKSNTGANSIRPIDKMCNCAKSLDSPTDTVYYTGDAGLVRFMNQKDTTFFTQSLT